jgi:hypothetical protein
MLSVIANKKAPHRNQRTTRDRECLYLRDRELTPQARLTQDLRFWGDRSFPRPSPHRAHEGDPGALGLFRVHIQDNHPRPHVSVTRLRRAGIEFSFGKEVPAWDQ